MIDFVFNTSVQVKRRVSSSASRDVLNNPVYGTPTAGWPVAYTSMPCRIALSSKPIVFTDIGERITPQGIVYASADYSILPEDRLITTTGIEYVVTSVVNADTFPGMTDHIEIIIELP